MRPAKRSTDREPWRPSKRSTDQDGWRERVSRDDGSASLEFITAGLILLLPLVYLILAMASLQAGALAVEGASRQAARVFVRSADPGSAEAAARRAVEVALADYGLDAAASTIEIVCTPHPTACLTRRGSVTVSVRVDVVLPLVPPVLDVALPLSVPLQASATQQVSRFWGAAP